MAGTICLRQLIGHLQCPTILLHKPCAEEPPKSGLSGVFKQIQNARNRSSQTASPVFVIFSTFVTENAG